MLHDPEVYHEPQSFLPERFLKSSATAASGYVLNPDILDPVDVAFGFGRRICPGRYMAYESMWLTVASVLAAFKVEMAADQNGDPITPTGQYSRGFVRCVLGQMHSRIA